MRHEDWANRLNKVIEDVRDDPLVWGVHDCFTFINATHYAVTDEQLEAEWLGDYSTGLQARKHYLTKLKETGHRDIVAALDFKLSRNVNRARGSIVARRLESDGVLGYSLGVVVSDRIAFLTLNGLDFLVPQDGDIFWSVE